MSEEATPENREVVRDRIETAVPAVLSLRAAKEAGVPVRVAFRRYAKRVREDLVRSAGRRARGER